MTDPQRQALDDLTRDVKRFGYRVEAPVRMGDGRLWAPVYDRDDHRVSAYYIHPDGSKELTV